MSVEHNKKYTLILFGWSLLMNLIGKPETARLSMMLTICMCLIGIQQEIRAKR
jgi:hypothetical protein